MADIVPGSLEDLLVDVDTLTEYPGNPRVADVGRLADSLRTNGQYRPIVVNRRNNEILAGNHTWKAAKKLGWTKIAATFVDADDDLARRIVLTDNRQAELGGYDDAALTSLLQAIADDGDGLAGTGWGTEDLDDLLAAIQEAPLLPPAPAGATDTPGPSAPAQTNVKQDSSYEEFLERYANRTVRSLVLDFSTATFIWAVETLDTIRQGPDESNADVVLRLISEASGREIPKAD